MSYTTRLNKAYEGALKLPLHESSKYVIFSDCHRGDGTTGDNFLPNKPLYLAALRHYFTNGFTYIENGDGDELWENRCMEQIMEIHKDVFHLLSLFHQQNRLYMLFGNHDMVKSRNNPHPCGQPLIQKISFHEALLLEPGPHREIFITHGHQSDILNSTLWPLTCFLVRHLWSPLEHFGISDPTSAAKNNSRKKRCERRLQQFAKQKGHLLLAGHTHRPYLSENNPYYCNCGSCIHPYNITCLEIERLHISLVKWHLSSDRDKRLFVKREVLAGPSPLQ